MLRGDDGDVCCVGSECHAVVVECAGVLCVVIRCDVAHSGSRIVVFCGDVITSLACAV